MVQSLKKDLQAGLLTSLQVLSVLTLVRHFSVCGDQLLLAWQSSHQLSVRLWSPLWQLTSLEEKANRLKKLSLGQELLVPVFFLA